MFPIEIFKMLIKKDFQRLQKINITRTQILHYQIAITYWCIGWIKL